MNNKQQRVTTANWATADIAYKTNEVFAVYPITPSSEMSELVEEWNAKGQRNVFGAQTSIFEMQSEAGVAGAMHGALQTGSLATTFTASQGLLLMIPNMYKIAGELTPNVIHVATRSLATHALSVFGDHSDIMAARTTGYAFLGGASVQEAHDFALISQASTLASRIPFVHFFDGFRTSHETAKIESIPDSVIAKMMNQDDITSHYSRRLNPNAPVLRGTSQGPDVFFQSREAVNSYYNACPEIVQNQMDKFAKLTGRTYRLFDYVGHPEAERIIIAMASATETIEDTVNYLTSKDEKVGLIKVRLFRPFSIEYLLKALPFTCKAIAVLDRTKESGASGEPLYLDIVASMMSNKKYKNLLPTIVGGRYGLSSKEFHPGMVKAIFDNIKLDNPKNNFTIGIEDDITNLSLDYPKDLQLQSKNHQILLYETKSEKTCDSFKSLLEIIGQENFVQGYSEIDYKKSDSQFVSNLRVGKQPIKAPYLISEADVIICDSINFLERVNVLNRIKVKGTLLICSPLSSEEFFKKIPLKSRHQIVSKDLTVLVENTSKVLNDHVVDTKVLSGLHAYVLALLDDMPLGQDLTFLKNFISQVQITTENDEIGYSNGNSEGCQDTFFKKMMTGKGHKLKVSEVPVDGTYETDTTKFHGRNNGSFLPDWDSNACMQCGACVMACPQGVIRGKVYNDSYLGKAPEKFKAAKAIDEAWKVDLLNYTIQLNPEQCTSCNNCIDACPTNALAQKDSSLILNVEKENWNHFENIPEFDRLKLDLSKVEQQQLQEPLFKYSFGVDGCGEAPYLKLLSQLFGDRMLVANATGASSIFGGALPFTPWAKNNDGRGPAWSNSLFEDNAEFGLGYRLSLDQREKHAKRLLSELLPEIDFDLAHGILTTEQKNEAEINAQRNRVEKLKNHLTKMNSNEAQHLAKTADSLVKQSVWIVGGDGWAYDIGYGGLDHVAASGKNVNILVLDNQVYSNTGGQMSKATPFGATAKYAYKGKQKQRKDLGRLLMTYDNVYVAQVAIGANQQQVLRAFQEAESFDGPSIIIAYCHSPSHGIDTKNPSQYHKAAVRSGQWLLYRNDPRRLNDDKNPFQLDSDKPSLPLEDYLRMERRFAQLFQSLNGDLEFLLAQQQLAVNEKFNRYFALAGNIGEFKIHSSPELQQS